MSGQDQHQKLRHTPGGVIAAYAYEYAVKFYDFAVGKYPELKQHEPDYRCTWHQSAIIVATLIQMERLTAGAGARELHDNTSRALPAQARHRLLTAIQDLSAILLDADKAGFGPESIPSYAGLAGADDKKLSGEIGTWLARSIVKRKDLSPPEALMAAGMGRSAWTSAVMITRILRKKNKN